MGEQERPEGEPEPTLVDPFGQAPPATTRPWPEGGRWGPPSVPPATPRWEDPAPDWGQAPTWSPGPQQPGPPPGPTWPQSQGWGAPTGWPAPAASAWYPQPAPPAGRRGGGRPLAGEERRWVPASHWVALLTTWLGPLVILLTVGERNARVREHAKESLNFEITFWLGMLVAALLTFVLVGYLLLVLLPVVWLVFRIVATVEASHGKDHRYPFTLRIIR